MSKIVWVGNPFFASQFKDLGWDLCCLNFKPGDFFTWDSLREKTGLETSDILVLADKSLPPVLPGVEKFPCLTVFYSVDSHIHSWHPFYAQAFDLCLVSLKDNLPFFGGKRLLPEQILWMPPCLLTRPVSPEAPETAVKQWDLLFVGTVDPAINPDRVAFMRRLKEAFPAFHYCRGNYSLLYPQARLVLNHSISGDLNFRVFEALGSGACLLTPHQGHGLTELFTDGQDLFLFDQQDLSSLLSLIHRLLAEPETRLAAALSGFKKISAAHLAAHRAGTLNDILRAWRKNGQDEALIQARLKTSTILREQYLRLMYLLLAESMRNYPELREAYLAASAENEVS